MATGPEIVRKNEVHCRDETNRAKIYHLWPLQSGEDLLPVSVEGGKSCYVQRPSTVGSGRRSAGATTRWLVTSGIMGDGNVDVTSYTDSGDYPGQSLHIAKTVGRR